jgi:1-phosphatidylinositol-4-phosphate 5-kinase
LTAKQIVEHVKQDEVKHNISVYFGHENWNLILNMMIGMRKAIKSLQPFF